jgi:hypothetical protein
MAGTAVSGKVSRPSRRDAGSWSSWTGDGATQGAPPESLAATAPAGVERSTQSRFFGGWQMRTLGLMLAIVALTVYARADEFRWLNVNRFPDDLIATTDAWTAARIEPGASYRIAAEDFVLDGYTRIERITHWTVKFETPVVLATDWYIYDGEGPEPGQLLAGDSDVAFTHEPAGFNHNTFGTIYRNAVEPQGLILPAGEYYAAFRTLIADNGHKHSILTTRWANGLRRAYWNFGVLADGTVTQPWQLMQVFNLVEDQEWAVMIEGETLPTGDVNCDGALDAFDIEPFILALVDPNGYATQYPDCEILLADMNGDGEIDAFDIGPFIDALVGP